MKMLVIDNYDSFTYNLVQYLGELGVELTVHRNDKINLSDIRNLAPDAIIISPGPGVPADSGISTTVIREFSDSVAILGVCLGHQAIYEAFGGIVDRAPELVHGKVSFVNHDDEGIFKGLPNPFSAARYHSLIADPKSCPAVLNITARAAGDLIMGIAHKHLPLYGVQFHPESFLTECGMDLLRNFVNLVARQEKQSALAAEI